MEALTIEQMNVLKKLGCNVSLASRAYLAVSLETVVDDTKNTVFEKFIYDKEPVSVDTLSEGYLATKFGKNLIYAFTVSDITDLFRAVSTKSFVENGNHYYTADDIANHHSQSYKSLLHALYRLLISALEDKQQDSLLENARL